MLADKTAPATLSSSPSGSSSARRVALLPAPGYQRAGRVLHTTWSGAPEPLALERLQAVATTYSNLELDLVRKERGSRYSHVEAVLRRLTGAEDALVVAQQRAAVLLALETLAHGREVIVSVGS